jgi:hypothetical protein
MKIFFSILFLIGNAYASATGSGMSGSGGAGLFKFSHAWNIGNAPVTFCIHKVSEVKFSEDELYDLVQTHVNSWKVFYNRVKSTQEQFSSITKNPFDKNLISKTLLKNSPEIDFNFERSCDDNTDIQIYFGVMSKEIALTQNKYDDLLGYADLVTYNPDTGRGKGTIWISDKAFNIKDYHSIILLHELGHVFGVPHATSGIMNADIASFSMDELDINVDSSRSLVNYFDFLRKLFNWNLSFLDLGRPEIMAKKISDSMTTLKSYPNINFDSNSFWEINAEHFSDMSVENEYTKRLSVRLFGIDIPTFDFIKSNLYPLQTKIFKMPTNESEDRIKLKIMYRFIDKSAEKIMANTFFVNISKSDLNIETAGAFNVWFKKLTYENYYITSITSRHATLLGSDSTAKEKVVFKFKFDNILGSLLTINYLDDETNYIVMTRDAVMSEKDENINNILKDLVIAKNIETNCDKTAIQSDIIRNFYCRNPDMYRYEVYSCENLLSPVAYDKAIQCFTEGQKYKNLPDRYLN